MSHCDSSVCEDDDVCSDATSPSIRRYDPVIEQLLSVAEKRVNEIAERKGEDSSILQIVPPTSYVVKMAEFEVPFVELFNGMLEMQLAGLKSRATAFQQSVRAELEAANARGNGDGTIKSDTRMLIRVGKQIEREADDVGAWMSDNIGHVMERMEQIIMDAIAERVTRSLWELYDKFDDKIDDAVEEVSDMVQIPAELKCRRK